MTCHTRVVLVMVVGAFLPLRVPAQEMGMRGKAPLTVSTQPSAMPSHSPMAATVDLVKGLTAYYSENDGHGDQVGTNHGTAQGSVAKTSGQLGGAYQFNGQDSGSDPRVSARTGAGGWQAGSVSVWVRSTAYTSGNMQTVWQVRESGSWGHLWLAIHPATRAVHFHVGTGSGAAEAKTTHVLASNVWYHIVATWNRGTNKASVYLNGGREGQVSVPAWGRQTNELYWGAGFNGYGMRGVLDEIGLWDRELGDDEIAALYNDGRGLAYPFSTTGTPASGLGDAAITSPEPGSTLPKGPVKFQWSAATGATGYVLYLETKKGYADIFRGVSTTDSSVTVSAADIPDTGQRLYARLEYRSATERKTATAEYDAPPPDEPVPAQMSSPRPHSMLSGRNVTFKWDGGKGVSEYWLQVGSGPGEGEVFDTSVKTSTSQLVRGLPTDGRVMWVRLGSRAGQDWRWQEYWYRAADVPVTDIEVTKLEVDSEFNIVVGGVKTPSWAMKATIRNTGDSPAGAFKVRYHYARTAFVTADDKVLRGHYSSDWFFSPDTEGEYCEIPKLDPDEEAYCAFSNYRVDLESLVLSSGTPGPVFLAVIADPENELSDPDRTNNLRVAGDMLAAANEKTGWRQVGNDLLYVPARFAAGVVITFDEDLAGKTQAVEIDDGSNEPVPHHLSSLTLAKLAGRSVVAPGGLVRITAETPIDAANVKAEVVSDLKDDDRLVYPPSGVEMVGVSRGLVRVSWVNNEPEASGFDVQIYEVGTDESTRRNLQANGDDKSLDIEVTPGRTYCGFVRTKASRGWFGNREETSRWATRVNDKFCAVAPEI